MRTERVLRVTAGCVAYWGVLGAASAATYTAYVPICCNAPSSVSIIGTTRNRVSGAFTAGGGSYALAIPTAGTAWVTNEAASTISVIDMASGAMKHTITLSLQPWLIKASVDGTRIYVITGNFTGNLNHFSANLLTFNARTYALLGSAALANDGLMNPGLAVAPDGQTVYATFDSQNIEVYDTATAAITASWETSRALTWTASGTLTLSPDGSTLYTAGQAINAFDTATGQIRGTVNPPGPPRNYSFVGTAITADGSTLYATYAAQIGTGGFVASIDTASLAVTGFESLGVEPQQPVLSLDGSTLYVPDALDSVVYMTSTASLTASSTIALPGPIATATLAADGSALYVPSESTSGVLAVNPASFAVIASIPVGSDPTAPSATANGKSVYIGGVASNNISRIKAATDKLAGVFANDSPNRSVTGPNSPSVLVTPNGRQVYLGTNASQTVSAIPVVETATGVIGGVTCPATCTVEYMVASPDSTRVYASGLRPFGDDGGIPFFYVIDTAAKKVIANATSAAIGPMAASPTGAFLYIVTSSEIQVFDTTQNAVTKSLPLGGIYAIAFSPDGSIAYAATASAVEFIDTSSGLLTGSIGFGSSVAPIGIAVSPDGSQVWVTPADSSTVLVVTPASGSAQTVSLGTTVSGVAFGIP